MADPLPERTAVELAALIRRREVSAVEVMDAHLERLAATNPRVNAVVTLVADSARRGAEAADRALAAGESVGPLHGLPVVHKDLVPTKGIRTTFGSRIYESFVPRADGLLVERLRAAGAITLGKTNTPEFGAGSQTFNEVFGPTRNPWELTKTPGGSSGGAAAALACGMVPLADGSDFGGSLRNPASFCGVVGFRPSAGLVPMWPNETPRFPVPVEGPMARTVADAALMLSALAGRDERAPLSFETPAEVFRAPLEADFRGVRVAWAATIAGLPFDPAVTAALAPARRVLESLGCEVEEAAPDLEGGREIFRRLRAWYFHRRFRRHLRRHRELLKDTVAGNIEEGARLSAAEVREAERGREEMAARAARFFDRYRFLALPVAQVPPFAVEQEWVREIAGVRMNSYIEWMESCSLVSLLGVPAISVPFGRTPDDLPVGLQIVGRATGDHRGDLALLRFAHAFEQAAALPRRFPAMPG